MMSSLRHALFICTLTAALACLLGHPTQAQDQGAPPVFRVESQGVRVDVAVTRFGRPVNGLTIRDFELTDDGVPQQISGITTTASGIDVTVALDLSSSVSGDVLQRLRQAIDRLGRRLRPDDRMRLVTFNMRVQRLVDFSDPRPRIAETIAAATASGSTSMFDTIAVLLASPAPPDRRNIIIVFSDGTDTMSITAPDTLVAIAQRTTPTVAFVLPSEPVPGRSGALSAPAVTPAAALQARPGGAPGNIYETLATETGGVVLQSPIDRLESAFGRLLDDFRERYVLYYSPRETSRPGFHALGVRVVRGRDLEVHARRGYIVD